MRRRFNPDLIQWAQLAAVLILAALVGVAVALVSSPASVTRDHRGLATSTFTPPSPSPSPSPSASPVATPFVCTAASAFITHQSPPPLALIDGVSIGTHAGYDRLTIEFKTGQTGAIELLPQTNTTFVRDPRGDTVKLAGKDGILVRITGADGHTAYKGSTDIKTTYKGLLEVRQVGDFGGKVQWALGLSSTPCYRAVFLTNPGRLVIDIQVG